MLEIFFAIEIRAGFKTPVCHSAHGRNGVISSLVQVLSMSMMSLPV